MIVGIPKEIMFEERRVAAIPETVAAMIKNGHTVLVQKNAGVGSFFSDRAYQDAGATIIDDVAALYDQADAILKVKEPLFNQKQNKHEIDMMHQGQYLITFIHPASPVNHDMVRAMTNNGIIGLTLDGIPRISRAQNMDALSSMSTCAGYKGMLMAADTLPKFCPMIGTAVGMIKPSTVLVIGTGVAGLRAVATAKSLGAVVYSADIRPEANEQAKSLGARIVNTGIPAEIAVSADGKHANKLSDEWLEIERQHLKDAVANADIVFCSALLLGKKAPILLTDEMVASMKAGSTIVDISIDQGGNCAITTAGKIDTKHDVVIQGIKNIPGLLPTSSTYMFSHNVLNLFNYLTQSGTITLDLDDEIVSSILVCKDNKLVHSGTIEAMSGN